jgi:ketosteroid isomerase-like protein
MRFHITKVIEDRSAAVVAQALEKCLKREAWEVRRHDMQVIALGIGTSRNTVNLSDNAKFDIDSGEEVTLVRADVEYQNVWFLSEDLQHDAVHARFESVFANMRAALDLSPERVIEQGDAGGEPASLSESPSSTDASTAVIASVPTPQLGRKQDDTTEQASPSGSETSSAASPMSSNSRCTPEPLLPLPPAQRPRFLASSVRLIGACILVVISIASWRLHSNVHPSNRSRPPQSPSVRRVTQEPAPPSVKPRPLASTSLAKANLAGKADQKTDPSSFNRDPRRWLEQWAASQRTRDANRQASFYAEDVRPYLTLQEASRDAVYEDKRRSIDNRRGLWTFTIEDVTIRRESADTASVSLRKHFMMQAGSVQVSEQRMRSLLTLKRTQDGWRIVGERDLR